MKMQTKFTSLSLGLVASLVSAAAPARHRLASNRNTPSPTLESWEKATAPHRMT
jgi:hypothetical protein